MAWDQHEQTCERTENSSRCFLINMRLLKGSIGPFQGLERSESRRLGRKGLRVGYCAGFPSRIAWRVLEQGEKLQLAVLREDRSYFVKRYRVASRTSVEHRNVHRTRVSKSSFHKSLEVLAESRRRNHNDANLVLCSFYIMQHN